MRRLPGLLTATVLSAVTGLVVAAAPSPVAAAAEPASGSLRARVAALQAEVDAAGSDLEAGARAYEQAAGRLAVLTQQQFAVQDDLEHQQTVSVQTQSGVDALVRAAYKGQGLPPTLAAIMSGDPRALSDLARLRAAVDSVDTSRRAALGDLTRARSRTGSLLAQKTALRRQALAQQQAVDARQAEAARQATALRDRLAATAAALREALAAEAAAALRAQQEQVDRAAAEAVAQAAAAAAAAAAASGTPVATSYVPGTVASGGGDCAPVSDHGYANGFLPDAVLCPVPGHPGHRLRTDADRSFVALDAARRAAGLPGLCLTDSYRDFAGQVDVFARKPQLAAVPGRSQHGWGLALDLGCGAASFDSEVYAWLTANAPRFGWVNPAWARPGGSKPEPWHWEFQGQ